MRQGWPSSYYDDARAVERATPDVPDCGDDDVLDCYVCRNDSWPVPEVLGGGGEYVCEVCKQEDAEQAGEANADLRIE